MGVQLTVIGSSPAWPNPGAAHAGYLVRGDGRLLLDCGPGVLSRLRSAGAVDVDAIAITHFHLDHWGDLVPWVWMAERGLGPERSPALWLPPGGRVALAAFAERLGHEDIFGSAFRVSEYAAAVPFDAAGFVVEAHRVTHYDTPAYGFRVRDAAGTVLAYSGDSGPCDALHKLAKGADLFLCEATLASAADDPGPRGHLSAEEALAAGDGRVLLTHRPAELPVPAGAERAVDGLTVEV
jgi:ribonuclease BN (tRNA processing enzyme)